MTQPRFTPIESRDEVRAAKHLDTPRPWQAHRPGEIVPGAVPSRARIGTAGPDQGYALWLAEGIADGLVLGAGEHLDDVLAVVVQVALVRAARFGRAPVSADLEVAVAALGYRAPIAGDALAARRAAVLGVGHDNWRCRELANSIPAEVVSLTPVAAENAAVDWTALTTP